MVCCIGGIKSANSMLGTNDGVVGTTIYMRGDFRYLLVKGGHSKSAHQQLLMSKLAVSRNTAPYAAKHSCCSIHIPQG